MMKVEIWSDIVCPWCYIGKRRFETALAQFAHRAAVEVVWRSFELDPDSARRSPGALTDLLARKKGISPARAEAAHAQLTALAAEEGLEYRFDLAQHGNTFDAHRLLHLAAAHGLQGALKERLLKAYFTEGLPIGDTDTLVTLAAEAGLDTDETRQVLAGDAYAADVRADEKRAARFGIRGVPFGVLDESYGVSGAQPAAVFLDALEQAWAAAYPLALVGSAGAGDACAGNSCVV